MTLNEPEKQNDGGERGSGDSNEEESKRATDHLKSAQDSSTQAVTAAPAAEENKQDNDKMQWNDEQDSKSPVAATKRTFDQISDGQSKQVGSETELATVEEKNVRESVAIPSDTCEPVAVDEEKAEETVSEPVTFNVVYAKEKFEVTFDLNGTVTKLKEHLQKLTSVVSSSQKLCYKGNLSDPKTLKECNIKDGVKVLMIGSKTNDIVAVASVTKDSLVKETKEPAPAKEPLCQQKQHKKIIDKGVPEQVMSAWTNEDCHLPFEPLTGMLNKYGNKVRITFKLEQDQVWISTKERTQKIPMTSIISVISEPIDNHPQYHIMGLQIGPTEASRIWFYWVPAQYIRAIKNVILNS